MTSRTIDLNNVEIKTALKIMVAETGVGSFSELAKLLEMKDTTLRSAINNGALRLSDFLKIAKLLGYKVTVTTENNIGGI